MPSSRPQRLTWSEDPLTARARTVWSAGDYRPIARSYQAEAEAFVARLALAPSERVLDAGCGTGIAAAAAAAAGAQVTAIDLAPPLITEAQLEARSRGLLASFDLGDLESLPYADGQFDTVISMFGAMYAYRPERAARELVRVTRPGGRIVLATWAAEGLMGEVWEAHGSEPAGVPSPLLWADEPTLRARLGDGIATLACRWRTAVLRFALPPAAVTEVFAASYGPTVTALRTLGPEGACRLRRTLTRLFEDQNRAVNGTTMLVARYLEAEARVR